MIITGTNFGASQGTGTVTFAGTQAAVTNWSTTSITATVPSGAVSGNVVVTVGSLSSNGVTFTVLPTPSIASLSPTSGVVWASVAITGSNFGAYQGTSIVTFSGATAPITSWSATSISTEVPAGATTGNVVVTVGGIPSNGVSFTVLPMPSITTLSPASGAVGSSVTIAGSNFGASQGASTVTFGGVAASASSWSNTSITAAVPPGATTGAVVVTVSGVASNGSSFTVLQSPAISSLTPSSGAVGVTVTITGTNFGSSQDIRVVMFNGQVASITGWTSDPPNGTLTVKVPAGATSGNVVVYINGTSSNAMAFTVLPPPSITTLAPSTGTAGTSATITGANFGSSQGSGSVTFAGSPATVTSWSDTVIAATVPVSAGTGSVVVTANGASSNGLTFTTIPSITSLTPSSAVLGAQVTITGSNFGYGLGGSTVALNGSVVSSTSWYPGNIAFNVPAGATTGNVVVTVGGIASNAVSLAVVSQPTITGLTPSSGAPGTQVTISGSGFGAAQGSGFAWLGSTVGTIVSWSDNTILATVASNARSGNAQVRQNGLWSSAVPFDVTTATISGVSPISGVPGTVVTISGSGFGAAQGSGQVWLGTATGVVQSWSDAQIVAQVASGAATGNAQVLQGGALSNAVLFTINSLHLTKADPAAGAAGTTVTVSGNGFGAVQGAGSLILGTSAAAIASWSDTQIVATVAAGSLSGVASVQQNSVSSNAVPFTVLTEGGNTVEPAVLNLVVGDTHQLQALSAAGQPVTGLTWTSSDPAIVSLSSDDPPVLTALIPGHVRVTAGTGSVDVSVSASALPSGTVLWSNPGTGSGVAKIVPAVPSPSGVADVFAFQNDGTVQAIKSDGTTSWVADVSNSPAGYAVPDFQGGLIVRNNDNSLVKLDGLTGQPLSIYTPDENVYLNAKWAASTWPDDAQNPHIVVHSDGTLFAIEDHPGSYEQSNERLIGIDSATGSKKFSIPLEQPDDQFGFRPLDLIIAGDGYAYFPYESDELDMPAVRITHHLRVLKTGTDGSSSVLNVFDWTTGTHVNFGELPDLSATAKVITNADQGILLSWSYVDANWDTQYGMATITQGSVSLLHAPTIPGQQLPVRPDLQAEDGSFVGTTWVGDEDDPDNWVATMVAFDATGSVRWAVQNEEPQIATEGGGVISRSGMSYDQIGRPAGQNTLAILSWLNNVYQLGSVDSLIVPSVYLAATWWAFQGGNHGKTGTAILQQEYPELRSCKDTGYNCSTKLQPRDLIWNARNDLINQLRGDQNCQRAAQTWLYAALHYGLLHTKLIDAAVFAAYIRNTWHFYDGTKSSLDAKNLGVGGTNPPMTVAKRWFDAGSTTTAVAGTPSSPLITFWQPADATQAGGVGIDPTAFGMNVLNESNLLHEALHGYTGQDDAYIQTELRALDPAVGGASDSISAYIRQHILSACPVATR